MTIRIDSVGMIAPIEGTFVEPLPGSKIFIASKSDHGRHVTDCFLGGDQLVVCIANSERFFHVIEWNKLPDSRITPDGIREMSGVIDGGPELWPYDCGRIIDRECQDAALIQEG
ncbi:MAG: hypothetical protein LC104_21595 [Bacteroidales bacterium]|nr:hypothetical protein [Bacteroidales bacterium]